MKVRVITVIQVKVMYMHVTYMVSCKDILMPQGCVQHFFKWDKNIINFFFFFFRTPLSTSVTISPQKLDPLKEIQLLKQQQEQLQQLQELEKRFKQTSSASYASPSSSASSSTYNSQTASTTYMSAERTHAGFQDKSKYQYTLTGNKIIHCNVPLSSMML